MATTLQLRRGTTAEANALTGAAGEVFVDLTTKTMRLHDGTTAGGLLVGGAGSPVSLVATITPTASNAADFSNVFTSQFDTYMVVGNALAFNPSASGSGSLRMFPSVGGSVNFDQFFYPMTIASQSSVTTSSGFFTLSPALPESFNNAGVNFILQVQNVNQGSTGIKSFTCMSSSKMFTGYGSYSGIAVTDGAAITGLQLRWSHSANFKDTQGVIRVYGFKNS
jgi:hypothetical protein